MVGITFVYKKITEVWGEEDEKFNIALLGKWCWRLLVDGGSMWYRVLAARYGEEDGKLGQSGSSWWYIIDSVVQ